MIYHCENCRCTFESEAEWPDKVSCPNCGMDDDLTEGERCKECGDLFAAEDMLDGFCPSCRGHIVNQFREMLATFTEDERELLTDIYEGQAL